MGEQKVNFFCTKIVWFSPSAKQADATQTSHSRAIVTSYLVTAVDWGLGGEARSRSAIFVILQQKNSNFNAV